MTIDKGFALAAALLLASGCMPPAPDRGDALSALSESRQNPRLKRIKLALVLSQGTRNTADYLRKAQGGLTGRYAGVSDVTFFRSINEVLSKTFGEVITVDGLEQARAGGAHLAAVLDLHAKIGVMSFQTTTAEVSADFRALDESPVAVAKGKGAFPIPWPNTSLRWTEASQEAVESFARALASSAELGAFAAKLPDASPAAVAAAPAAAKAFRSDVETPPFRFPEDPSKFALVVGVETYATLPPAEHAVRDAVAVKAHLLALGYPERNVVFLTDGKAVKSALEKYLEAWLPRNTDASSKVFVYFSGHGAPDPATGQAYLVPWDGDPKFIETTGYPIKRFYERLNALKAKEVLVAMDSCFSGAGGRSVIARGLRPLVGRVDAGANIAGRVGALAAAAADETTGADQESGHGLFTYQLLRALDARSGRATLKELYDALSPKVRDAARRDNRDQTPQLIGSGASSL